MVLQVGSLLETQFIGVGIKYEAMIVRNWKVKASPPSHQAWLDELVGNFLFYVSDLQSFAFRWTTIKWRTADFDNEGPYTTYTWSGLTGRNGNSYGPQQIAWCISVIVEDLDEVRNGRIFIPAVPFNIFVGGNIEAPWTIKGNQCADNIAARYKDGGNSPYFIGGVKKTTSPRDFIKMVDCKWRPEPSVIRSRRWWV